MDIILKTDRITLDLSFPDYADSYQQKALVEMVCDLVRDVEQAWAVPAPIVVSKEKF